MNLQSNSSNKEHADGSAHWIKKDFSSLVDNVEQRILELDRKEKHWARLEASMEENASKASDKITLDIGGQKFSTSKSTLLSHKGSFFDAMLSSGRWKPDAKGRYFIDRNPELFPVILDYLRTGKVNLKRYSYNVMDDLKSELDFYLIYIPELAEQATESLLLSKHNIEKIKEWIRKKVLTRIYSATRDGFGVSIFHAKCDNKGPTVVVARSTSGYVFGGYATASWDCSNQFKTAAGCFLFTLSNPHGIVPTVYPLCRGEENYAMHCTTSNGPSFGFPCSYADTTGYRSATFVGSSRFDVNEVEVFKVQ